MQRAPEVLILGTGPETPMPVAMLRAPGIPSCGRGAEATALGIAPQVQIWRGVQA